MTKNTKAVLTYGGVAAGVFILYLLFKKKKSAANIIAAKNTAVATPASPGLATAPGNLNPQSGIGAQPVVPGGTSETPVSIQTPGGQISTVPLYFAAPTADSLYFAPQNSL